MSSNIVRLLSLFGFKFMPGVATECWGWKGARNNGGYGVFYHRGRTMAAHRFAYETCKGPLVKGLVIDHLCNNRACVNPDHLRQCTTAENTMAAHSFTLARLNAEKTHCLRGHEFTPENTLMTPSGRNCKQCNTERAVVMRRLPPVRAGFWKVCACGCGASFLAKNQRPKYLNKDHFVASGAPVRCGQASGRARRAGPRPCACGCGGTVTAVRKSVRCLNGHQARRAQQRMEQANG